MSITASEARRNLFPLIEQVNEDHTPIEISSRRGNAVLMSRADFDALEATAYLLRVPANAHWLLDSLAQAHICLGVFGTTRQANFTVQNKVWEGLAMGRPVISGDSPTIRAALADRQEVYLVARNSPEALAAGLSALRADPALRERIAAAGHARYLAGNSIGAIGRQMADALRGLVAARAGGR